MPGSRVAMPSTKPMQIAEAAAWRLIESKTREIERKRLNAKDCLTVKELCDEFVKWASTYYKNAKGEPTSMVAAAAYNTREFREMYGEKYVADLEHHDMLALRERLIEDGLGRVTVNRRMWTVKRMIGWALEEDLIYAQTKAELTQVANLKQGRSRAPEGKPVVAAPRDEVEAVIAVSEPNIADMIKVQILTGMRPGEICAMRWCDIEKRDTIWVYRPSHHKNEWRRQPRAIVIGPRAQGILSAMEKEGEYVFSPKKAQVERFERMREARKTRVQPSQMHRSKEEPMRSPGESWETSAYGRAIRKRCKKIGIRIWKPNQLRHNCATEVRRAFGIDAARAVLGHFNGLSVTDRYSFEAAEDEQIAVATPAMVALG